MYYFSGIDRTAFFQLLANEGAAGMVNATVATQPAMKASYERWPEVPMVLDSGAFQGLNDVVTYAEIVHEIGDRFRWVANLDVVGDQQASDRNWLRLFDDLDVRALWIYQVEGGKDLGHVRRWIECRSGAGPMIGVGGLVPVIKRDLTEALRLIERIGQVLQPWSKAHFFGVGSPIILREFGKEPWFASADSQSWLCGFKALELLTHSGSRLKTGAAGLELTREECAAQNIRQIHTWMRGGKPMQISLL
jgi:hypothetical protein